MTRTISIALAACATLGIAAPPPMSPQAEASATINGKKITIKYSAPSMRGRNIFGDGGIVSKDPTYPVWRAGANAATLLTSDADLDIGGLKVPKGLHTLYVQIDGPNEWTLIVNKKTGQGGLDYEKSEDLGRVKMTMTKPPAPIETFKITLEGTGGKQGKLTLAWEYTVASVAFTVL